MHIVSNPTLPDSTPTVRCTNFTQQTFQTKSKQQSRRRITTASIAEDIVAQYPKHKHEIVVQPELAEVAFEQEEFTRNLEQADQKEQTQSLVEVGSGRKGENAEGSPAGEGGQGLPVEKDARRVRRASSGSSGEGSSTASVGKLAAPGATRKAGKGLTLG